MVIFLHSIRCCEVRRSPDEINNNRIDVIISANGTRNLISVQINGINSRQDRRVIVLYPRGRDAVSRGTVA